MSSHCIYIKCSTEGCPTIESIYTGDAYTTDFSYAKWEGEFIYVPCKEHELTGEEA